MIREDLVIIYGMTFIEYDGDLYCNGAFGRYIDNMASIFNTVKLVVPVKKGLLPESEYKIISKNIEVEGLTHFSGFISAIKKRKVIRKEIKKYSKDWQSPIYLRHPNPFSIYILKLASKNKLPIILHLVGDTTSVIRYGNKYQGLTKTIALVYMRLTDIIIKRYIRKTPTLVNGSGLKRFYLSDNELVKEIRTSSFTKNEIVKNIKKFDKDNVKILYVGYLRHEKGIEYLLESIKDLDAENTVSLTIVGDGESKDELVNLTRHLGIEDIVNFKGYVPLGDDLFKIYRENDIFILPSISEGTPRVLIEAMANGLSVIATNVGGIPFTIESDYNGILVNPGSSKEITIATNRLIKNEELRIRLINNGIDFAKENTMESHISEVSKFIEDSI